MHSATKFIAGHSDLMAGILAVKGERCVLCSYLAPNDHTACCEILTSPTNNTHRSFSSIGILVNCWHNTSFDCWQLG